MLKTKQLVQIVSRMHGSTVFFLPEPGSKNEDGKGGWRCDENVIPNSYRTVMSKPRRELNCDLCVPLADIPLLLRKNSLHTGASVATEKLLGDGMTT